MTGMKMLGPLGGGPAGPKDPELDLDDPETNFNAMLKIRSDTSGKDFIFAFPGVAWAMVPGDGNTRVFQTFGIGAGRIEEVPEGWRIYNREVLYFMDPDTGATTTIAAPSTASGFVQASPRTSAPGISNRKG